MQVITGEAYHHVHSHETVAVSRGKTAVQRSASSKSCVQTERGECSHAVAGLLENAPYQPAPTAIPPALCCNFQGADISASFAACGSDEGSSCFAAAGSPPPSTASTGATARPALSSPAATTVLAAFSSPKVAAAPSRVRPRFFAGPSSSSPSGLQPSTASAAAASFSPSVRRRHSSFGRECSAPPPAGFDALEPGGPPCNDDAASCGVSPSPDGLSGGDRMGKVCVTGKRIGTGPPGRSIAGRPPPPPPGIGSGKQGGERYDDGK
mmetsp:Transcript_45441/g.95229  ORF Transcript_45441/g.95229 Transcript_45441/m.95229 type:complete len:266 (-) Transcript_45441:1358-2155(-)